MSLEYKDENETPAELPVRTPQPLYTLILIGAIVVVFAAQMVTGLEPSILSAGFVKSEFLADHAYWRLLTGATVHGGIAHIAMNSYAFYSFGRIFEVLSNRAHLAIVFLLSAIMGGLLSLAIAPDGISVGASGGIVGLIGYLAIYAFRRREFIADSFRRNLILNIGFIILFGLALYQYIDNSAHIGGIITGAVYGLIQIPSDNYVDPRSAGQTTTILGVASLAVFLAACAFSVFKILS